MAILTSEVGPPQVEVSGKDAEFTKGGLSSSSTKESLGPTKTAQLDLSLFASVDERLSTLKLQEKLRTALQKELPDLFGSQKEDEDSANCSTSSTSATRLAAARHTSDLECLVRFLRARGGNVDKARDMLVKHVKWVETFGPEKILQGDIMVPLQSGSMTCLGVNQFGNPILYASGRAWCPHKYSCETYVKFAAYYMTHLQKMILARQPNPMQCVWMFDLSYWAVWHSRYLTYQTGLARLLQDHFPERLKVAFVVNAPRIFSGFYKLLAPFLDAKTRKKARFVTIPTEKDWLAKYKTSSVCQSGHGSEVGDRSAQDITGACARAEPKEDELIAQNVADDAASFHSADEEDEGEAPRQEEKEDLAKELSEGNKAVLSQTEINEINLETEVPGAENASQSSSETERLSTMELFLREIPIELIPDYYGGKLASDKIFVPNLPGEQNLPFSGPWKHSVRQQK